MAAPCLFETLYLRPNTSSFYHAKLLMKLTSFARHVKELHLCDEIIPSQHPTCQACLSSKESFLKAVESEYGPYSVYHCQVLNDPARYLETCRAIVSSQSDFEDHFLKPDWPLRVDVLGNLPDDDLHQLVRSFPHLQRLRMTNARRDNPGDHDSYLSQLCSIAPVFGGKFHSFYMLELSESVRPIPFSCESFHFAWKLIMQPAIEPPARFQRLQHLHICFSFEASIFAVSYEDSRSRLVAWNDMLRETTMLRSLSLSIEHCDDFEPARGLPAQIFKILRRHRWPLLGSLSLDFCSVQEKDLVGFVPRHRSTLRHLSLAGIQWYQVPSVILPLSMDNVDRGCSVRTFWTIGKLASLETISIKDFMATRHYGCEFADIDEPTCMLKRMCDYLLGRGSFPYRPETYYALGLHSRLIRYSGGDEAAWMTGNVLNASVTQDDMVLDTLFPAEELEPAEEASGILAGRATEAVRQRREEILEQYVDESWQWSNELYYEE